MLHPFKKWKILTDIEIAIHDLPYFLIAKTHAVFFPLPFHAKFFFPKVLENFGNIFYQLDQKFKIRAKLCEIDSSYLHS